MNPNAHLNPLELTWLQTYPIWGGLLGLILIGVVLSLITIGIATRFAEIPITITAIITIVGTSILGVATLGTYKVTKNIVEILQDDQAEIKGAVIENGNLKVTVGFPNTKTQKNVLGEDIPVEILGKTQTINEFEMKILEQQGAKLQGVAISTEQIKNNLIASNVQMRNPKK